MTSDWTSKTAPDDADTPHEAEFEPWLRKAVHEPHRALVAPLPVMGQVIGGKYRIEAEVGAGGMGAVFRATHLVSDKPVALKWMFRPATDPRALRRLTREARAAGQIDHPNVVDVYDIGREGDASYLVMELLHGESLRQRLSRSALGPRELIDLLLPAMHGVAAAHRAGVIHRDLKPDNIFLCCGPEGEPRASKVLDFGIAAIASAEPALQSALTAEGALLGTPAYMAPEQLAQGGQVDVRSDVYALGVILYEALSGRLPFEAETYLGLALAIADGQPRGLRELRPEIPLELERIVLGAMKKEPVLRPQRMEALIEALEAFASPGLGGLRVGSQQKFERVVLAIAGLFVLMMSLWWFASGPQPRAAKSNGLPQSQSAAANQPAPQQQARPTPAPAGQVAGQQQAASGAAQSGSHAAAPAASRLASSPTAPRAHHAAVSAYGSARATEPAEPALAKPPPTAHASSASESQPKPRPRAHQDQPTAPQRRTGAIRVDEL